jgi:hypothetical protein
MVRLRRLILGGAAALAVALHVPVARSALARRAPGPVQPALLGWLGDPRLVRTIGLRYRRARPAEDEPALLAFAIAPRAITGEEWRRQCARRIRDDFTSDRTVLIDGWVLSVTEARECALWSLLNP